MRRFTQTVKAATAALHCGYLLDDYGPVGWRVVGARSWARQRSGFSPIPFSWVGMGVSRHLGWVRYRLHGRAFLAILSFFSSPLAVPSLSARFQRFKRFTGETYYGCECTQTDFAGLYVERYVSLCGLGGAVGSGAFRPPRRGRLGWTKAARLGFIGRAGSGCLSADRDRVARSRASRLVRGRLFAASAACG